MFSEGSSAVKSPEDEHPPMALLSGESTKISWGIRLYNQSDHHCQ